MEATMVMSVVIAIVVIALAFDFTNGFHDAANAIATSVSTRALSPRGARAGRRDELRRRPGSSLFPAPDWSPPSPT
jgi:hypothetical protein